MSTESVISISQSQLKYVRLLNSRELLFDSSMRSKGGCDRRVGGKIQSVGKRQLAPESCRYCGDDPGASSETNNPEKKVSSKEEFDENLFLRFRVNNPEVLREKKQELIKIQCYCNRQFPNVENNSNYEKL